MMDRGEMEWLADELEDIVVRGVNLQNVAIIRKAQAALRASAAPEEGQRARLLERGKTRPGQNNPDGYPNDKLAALSPDSRKAEPETDELGLFELGQSFLEEYEPCVREGAFPNFICADSPVEIIVHLINERDEARAGLRPATENGGSEIDADFARTLTDNAAYVQAIRASVIEECAKVAESLARFDRLSEKNYAKAIRALSPSPSVGTGTVGWSERLADRVMQLKDGGCKSLSCDAVLGLIAFVRDGEGVAQPSASREAEV